jgi:DNA mismatch repair protein MutS2
MGIAVDIVNRARELMGPHVAKVEELLASVADQQRRIEEERAALLAELEAVEADRAAARKSREQSRARFEKHTRAVHGEAMSDLKAARREIDEIRRQLRARAAEATLDDVRAATQALREPHASIARHEPRRPTPPGTAATPEKLAHGTPVIVPRLGRAEVVALLADNKVEIRMGSMRAVVPISEVLLDTHRNARRAGLPTRAKAMQDDTGSPDQQVQLVVGVPAGGKAGARTVETTIDVRGARADEAIGQVDRFVDESLMQGRDTIFVVHGHGTGALRAAIRAHLGGHKGIEKFRAGEQNEGGDGVTVAFLKG